MRRTSLILSLAIAGSAACDSPTATRAAPAQASNSLNIEAAIGFETAVDDVQLRVLPTMRVLDPTNALASSMKALTTAIETQDRHALRRAIAGMESTIHQIERRDGAAAVASDLDAIRLILDHARPLLDAPPSI